MTTDNVARANQDEGCSVTCPMCGRDFAAEDIMNCEKFWRSPCCEEKMGKLK